MRTGSSGRERAVKDFPPEIKEERERSSRHDTRAAPDQRGPRGRGAHLDRDPRASGSQSKDLTQRRLHLLLFSSFIVLQLILLPYNVPTVSSSRAFAPTIVKRMKTFFHKGL
ncbi:Hypothetical protein NTJ_13607 [Nesidiocoris tenuis]|uniref:Uncharacterized protein n=1 Tax=Nesidiocoris tenuis TaxID=355587 RepID=A0ABN7BAG8_9HEMI|nr:Hypothetical protein NTJ_13607 [Nesidiocoris tenuis]